MKIFFYLIIFGMMSATTHAADFSLSDDHTKDGSVVDDQKQKVSIAEKRKQLGDKILPRRISSTYTKLEESLEGKRPPKARRLSLDDEFKTLIKIDGGMALAHRDSLQKLVTPEERRSYIIERILRPLWPELDTMAADKREALIERYIKWVICDIRDKSLAEAEFLASPLPEKPS